jgi:hypothetical protein
VMVYIVETRGDCYLFASSSSRGLFFPAGTLEETAALFDGVRVRRGIVERTDEVAMTLSRMPSCHRLQDNLEAVETESCASRSHFESRSDECAVGFAI